MIWGSRLLGRGNLQAPLPETRHQLIELDRKQFQAADDVGLGKDGLSGVTIRHKTSRDNVTHHTGVLMGVHKIGELATKGGDLPPKGFGNPGHRVHLLAGHGNLPRGDFLHEGLDPCDPEGLALNFLPDEDPLDSLNEDVPFPFPVFFRQQDPGTPSDPEKRGGALVVILPSGAKLADHEAAGAFHHLLHHRQVPGLEDMETQVGPREKNQIGKGKEGKT